MYEVGINCQITNLSDIYIQYVGEIENGFFVDVGAYDGYQWSNTFGLARKGWKGILIEPNPITFESLMQVYNGNPRVSLVKNAVGPEGKIDLYLSHAISTTSEETAEIYRKHNWFYGSEQKVEVDCIPLDTILDRLEAPIGFEVLSIDTEGFEKEVLSTFDINKYQPKIVLVEASEHHPLEGFNNNAPAINEYFDQAKYVKIYSDEINNVYVRGDLHG